MNYLCGGSLQHNLSENGALRKQPGSATRVPIFICPTGQSGSDFCTQDPIIHLVSGFTNVRRLLLHRNWQWRRFLEAPTILISRTSSTKRSVMEALRSRQG